MSFEKVPDFLGDFFANEMNANGTAYRFGPFLLDVAERQLMRGDEVIPLTPKAFDVLAYLVGRGGHLVLKDELMNAVWPDSFVDEVNLPRTIHTLRRALGEDKNGDKFIETVPTKGYRFVANVEAATEPTSETGALAEPLWAESAPSVPDRVPSAAEAKPRVRIILFTVGFATAIFLIFMLSFNSQTARSVAPNGVRSIAVLPVKPLNAAQRSEVYEMGITDSLIHTLGSVKGFIIRPLSATRKYSDVESDPLAAGQEQKVDYVLASNYQIADGKIRITSQLLDVATGQMVETYKSEKPAAALFATQDAIAAEIGSKLMAAFGIAGTSPKPKRGTNNEEAYRLYLQGRLLTMQGGTQSHTKAIEYFEEAIKLDPNYAQAYARMAYAYHRGELLVPGVSGTDNILGILNKAFELDPDLAEAYVARGQLHLAHEWNLPAAEKDLLRAIELEPSNDTAHWLYALVLAARKHFDEALSEIEIAQTIDPSAGQYMLHRGRILYYARRYDEAVVHFERAADLGDNNFSNWMMFAYQMKGDDARAFEIFMKLQERWKSENIEVYRMTYESAGWQAVRRKNLEFARLGKNNPPFRSPFNLARECAQLGEIDEAFAYLEKAIEDRAWQFYTLDAEPAFDPLRGDPRFEQILGRVKLN